MFKIDSYLFPMRKCHAHIHRILCFRLIRFLHGQRLREREREKSVAFNGPSFAIYFKNSSSIATCIYRLCLYISYESSIFTSKKQGRVLDVFFSLTHSLSLSLLQSYEVEALIINGTSNYSMVESLSHL